MAEKKFSGREFRVAPMLATRAIAMQVRLFKILGPGVNRLDEVLRGFSDKATPEERAHGMIAAVNALSDIFAQADPEEVAGIMAELLKTAELKKPSGSYDPVEIDVDFEGCRSDIMPVVAWVIVEQFGDFFTGLLGSGSPNTQARR